MEDSRKLSNDPLFLLLIGGISMFLFIFAFNSIFVSDILGLIQAAACGFGIGLISAISQKRRPSRVWVADIVGSLIGIVIGALLIREKTQQPNHVWNQLILYILPISTVCGTVISSIPFIRRAIEQI